MRGRPASDLTRLLALLRPWRSQMWGGIALAAIAAGAAIGLMAVSGWFIAAMALAGASGAAINYYTPAAAIRGFAIVRTAGRYGERLVTHDATLRALSGLRTWLFRRLVPLAPARLAALRSADLFARLRADVDALEHFYLTVLVPILVAAIGVPMVAIAAVTQLPAGAWLLVGSTGLVGFVVPWWTLRQAGDDAAATVQESAALRGLLVDALHGHAELVAWNAAGTHAQAVAAADLRLAARRKRIDRIQGAGAGAAALVAGWTVPVLLLFGLAAVHRQALGGPALTMLVLLSIAAFELVAPLPEALAQWRATAAAAQRVLAVTDAEPAITEPEVSAPVAATPGVCFEGVHMRYAEDARWALDGVNLSLAPGERLAIVGDSGAGKSSLLNVLQKFYPIQSGQIFFGGRALDSLRGDDVRRHIAVIAQRTVLFNLSLRDNLLLAAPGATPAQIERAVADSQLTDFVGSLPRGYETRLGEQGALVSGGEARRIAIARALLRNSPLLILDEPTEGLDATTALRLYQALAVATRGRSVLLITHRLGGLASLVDRVAVMHAGRIVYCLDTAVYLERVRWLQKFGQRGKSNGRPDDEARWPLPRSSFHERKTMPESLAGIQGLGAAESAEGKRDVERTGPTL